MKKSEQIKINEKVLKVYDGIKHSIDSLDYCLGYSVKLRNCSAQVYFGLGGIYLKSYRTIIAYIPDNDSICYDFLRYVYGYTATSAQHIAKFATDYNAVSILSYKDI